MTVQEILTAISIGLTFVSISFVYFSIRHSRKKEFQDDLYKKKTEYYTSLIKECYNACLHLDINSSPFYEMYNIKTEAEFLPYFEAEITKLVSIGFKLQHKVNENLFYIPNQIIDLSLDFAGNCLLLVSSSDYRHIDLFIEKQDKLMQDYFNLVNAIRADLKIDLIDKSLKNRLSTKTI